VIYTIEAFGKDDEELGAEFDVTAHIQAIAVDALGLTLQDLAGGESFPISPEQARVVQRITAIPFDLDRHDYTLSGYVDVDDPAEYAQWRRDIETVRALHAPGVCKGTYPPADGLAMTRFLLTALPDTDDPEAQHAPDDDPPWSLVADLSRHGRPAVASALGCPPEQLGYAHAVDDDQARALGRLADVPLDTSRFWYQLECFTGRPMTRFVLRGYPGEDCLPDQHHEVSHLGADAVAALLGLPAPADLRPVHHLHGARRRDAFTRLSGLPLDADHSYVLLCLEEQQPVPPMPGPPPTEKTGGRPVAPEQ
jgi:hypothetical protein